MGVIAEEIEELIAEYIRNSGLVCWFDPDGHYGDLAGVLAAGQEQTIRFDGSFYKLRLEAEPFLRGLDEPKLLVYLPIPWEQAEEPLAEMLTLGATLRPGAPGKPNTRLAVVARRALKGKLPESRIEDLDKQIEQGSLTIQDLERLADESGGGPLPTVLAVHFRTPVTEEAALDFVTRPERDPELQARNGIGLLTESLQATFGLEVSRTEEPARIRGLLVRQVIISELFEMLRGDVPAALRSAVTAKDPLFQKRSAALCREWRNRRDLASSYAEAAIAVERGLHLDSMDFTDSALESLETFRCLELRLVNRVAARAAEADVANLCDERRTGFWAQQDPELQAQWNLVLQASQLLRKADEIAKAIQRPITAADFIARYTAEGGWSLLDTLQRRLEKRASSLEFALPDPAPEIEQLVNKARHRYEDVAGRMAECFLRAWRTDDYSNSGLSRQTEIFDRFVAPSMGKQRTAFLLVDALRWELARELPEVLGEAFECRIELVIGTAPSITEVGMAALLPSAASGLQIDGFPKWQVSLHGAALKNRQDRIAYLRDRAGLPVIDLKLEDPRGFRRKLKDSGNTPALVVVTSREIDQSGEDEMTTAREHMERVLTHISLALRKLAEEGVEQFVIATDHGYVYGEDLGEAEKIDPPGGQTAILHRRVWLGQSGANCESYLLDKAAHFGVRSDLEIAVPWNLTAFRTSGPTAYFHGGLSPQEILLPLILAKRKIAEDSRSAKRLSWELVPGSPKITTRFLSVRVSARSPGIFADITVRLEVRTGSEVCSVPVSGSYGFQETTGAVSLRSQEGNPGVTEPNTVTLMLTGKAPTHGTVSIHLLDASTAVELKKLENVEVSIVF